MLPRVLVAIGGGILWVTSGLALFVPHVGRAFGGPAYFFTNRTPVGRGSIRAWWMRMLMLFAAPAPMAEVVALAEHTASQFREIGSR